MHKHRFDIASLLAGLLFLTLAGLYVAGGLSMRAIVPIEVLGPGFFIALGAIGLVRVLTRRQP